MDANCESLAIKGLNDAYESMVETEERVHGRHSRLTRSSLNRCIPWPSRAKGTYFVFLMACYGSKTAEFETLCKLKTVFSKKILTEISSRLASKMIPKPKLVVWEVKASSLTTSPVNYAAFGMVEARGGLSTWFHSFFHVQKDKDPEQASSLEIMVEMYQKQVAKTIK
ncbi:hypothetical protein PVK06_021785 [Gossypium arboreum]|uniref:Uncharacterized protein n=1 Tax=Gossypium arboreum TaxID=29729 RepID=A0ABR0PQY8_GOSAR|nr:hypothetical protein PVK06_021785 [Gossypium arboreum]